MPATKAWQEDAKERIKRLPPGTFWHHDGNPERPYVRLSRGTISNVYFDGGKVSEWPYELSEMADELFDEFSARNKTTDTFVNRADRVVGPAMGAIPIAYASAREISCFQEKSVAFSYAEKDGDAFVFRRNPPQNGELILLVEDTITSDGSLLKVRDAVLAVAPEAIILPYVFALCNRSGKEKVGGLEIISYIDGDFQDWNEGENPFTPDRRELVPPVTNAKEQWDLLTKVY